MVSRWQKGRARCSLLTLLFGELLLVELEFLALKDVAIAAASLPWARGDAGEETSAVEHISDVRVDNSTLGVRLDLGNNVLGLLLVLLGLVALFNLLLVQLDVIFLKIPCSERVWID